MGHAKELISVDVYGDNVNSIPGEIPRLLNYMNEVLPTEAEGETGPVLVFCRYFALSGSMTKEMKSTQKEQKCGNFKTNTNDNLDIL